jgi:two-component system, sensor histidine kinase RpfC
MLYIQAGAGARRTSGRTPVHALREWWNAQRTRPNYGEFAQSVIRAGIGIVLGIYYASMAWEPRWIVQFFSSFIFVSFVLLAWTYYVRESSDFVRFLTLAIDIGTPTVLLGYTGERSAIVLFVYTWVAVGHGFRFGLRYLRVAWIASVVAFVGVYALSATVQGFWYRYPMVWLGALIWIAAPTFYVAMLLKQKLAAVQAAEEARVQAERARAEADRERVERARVQAERARAEAEAASEAKSDFLATMSHEMRTPLNGVVGAAEMLATKELPPAERQLVDWLLASARQLRSLIDNLLDLRRIEAGKMEIEPAPFDLHVLMNRLAALFEPEAKRAQLRFTKSVSADAPYLLIGDDARIQQVLINLTANAVKFTREGSVRVSVGALTQGPERVTLHFEVRDTGIGIEAEGAARIFERFTQASTGIHRQYGGSGLGTTICKHLVELMGGTINFGSRPGKGTTFWFTVPLARQAEAAEAAPGADLRDARLYFVSGRAGAGDAIAAAARRWRLGHARFASVADFIAASRAEAQYGPRVLLVDGEDGAIAWRDVPDAIARAGVPMPCALAHPGVADNNAFDAGYACVMDGRDERRLATALRSIVAGAPGAGAVPELGRQPPPGATGLRILVAEDNSISQQIIGMILRSGGHQVTVVDDGECVLEQYRNVSFDIAVLDMHMPGSNGLEVAREIRRLEAEGQARRMPIIMLTAAASTDLREHSLDAGIDLFLSKPIDPGALLQGVQQAFSQPGADAPYAPAARTHDGYLDRDLLKDMAALAPDAGFVRRLASRFADDAYRLVDRLESALRSGDEREFREIAHALKGAAMMTGAIRVRDAAARLETASKSGLDAIEPAAVRELRTTLEATHHALAAAVE